LRAKETVASYNTPKEMRDQRASHSDKSAGTGYEHRQLVEVRKTLFEKVSFGGFACGLTGDNDIALWYLEEVYLERV
jgi:hypothetical protein